MHGINLTEAKAHWSELVSKAESGEETILMRRGEAVAKLVPFVVPKKTLRPRAPFRATLRKAKTPSAALIRNLRAKAIDDLFGRLLRGATGVSGDKRQALLPSFAKSVTVLLGRNRYT